MDGWCVHELEWTDGSNVRIQAEPTERTNERANCTERGNESNTTITKNKPRALCNNAVNFGIAIFALTNTFVSLTNVSQLSPRLISMVFNVSDFGKLLQVRLVRENKLIEVGEILHFLFFVLYWA